MADKNQPVPDGHEVIFRTSFWHKGLKKRIYATDCGKRVFRLVIRKK